MPSTAPILLITASLAPSVKEQVRLVSVEERTEKYVEGLLGWLGCPEVKKIVFAKNCRAKIRGEVLSRIAGEQGKEIEFVQVKESGKTAFRGKGYGEGDMILQVLEKSELLGGAESFFKVTGKLYCANWGQVFSFGGDAEFFLMANARGRGAWRNALSPIYKSGAGSRLMGFLRRMRVPWPLLAASPGGWVDTRFYWVKTQFYRERLLCSHERVQDSLAYHLENAFFDDLEGVQGCCLHSEEPVILGTSGTMGTTGGHFSEEISGRSKEIARELLGNL